MIKGLEILALPVPEDDRGALIKIIQSYQLPGGSSLVRMPPEAYATQCQPGKFGEVYVVHDPAPDTVRAFHKHNQLWDYFCIIAGSAKFAFVDDRECGDHVDGHGVAREFYFPKPGDTQIVVTSGRRPKVIVVPPGVFHGWMSLEANTMMVSVGSELYDPRDPDEVRVPADEFDDLFGDCPWARTRR